MAVDALEMLRRDHRELLQKLERMCATSGGAEKSRERLCDEVSNMIETHTALEEELFYPAVEQAAEDDDDRELIAEAREEHAAVDKVLTDLRGTDVTTNAFIGRAEVLRELIEHHVEEEEEEVFDRARELLGEARLQQLGDQMSERREELLSELA